MSALYFCDVCKLQMTDADHGRVKKRLGNLEIEIMHALGAGWNSGHVCHHCVVEAVTGGVMVPSQNGKSP